MASWWSKLSSTMKIVLIVGVIGLLYALWPSSDAPKKAVVRSTKKSSATSTASDYTDEDFKAHFANLTEATKDSFKPLVIRSGAGGSDQSKQNAIPAGFAGGDANWVYSGTAYTDGVPTAFIENSSTGEGVSLQQGQHWKSLYVDQILPDSLVVKRSDGGDVAILHLASPEPAEEKEVKPVSPPGLSGPINISPFPNANPAAAGGGNAPAFPFPGGG